jgi:NAD(P)-dependent dehydrogenase (short-subunit alcohol dehydrogenase family)
MATNVAGKRILLLGGETAVGGALAVGLAEAGADVAIATLVATTEAEFAINSALNELWALDRRGLALAIHASDPGQVREAVERSERQLGRLDLATVSAPEGAVAIDALRAALAGRPVVVVSAGASAEEALGAVTDALRFST